MDKPTDAEVERVAKAMVKGNNRARKTVGWNTLGPLERFTRNERYVALATARAAIKALQKPTRGKRCKSPR